MNDLKKYQLSVRCTDPIASSGVVRTGRPAISRAAGES
jgi:hypothetical protein